MGITGFAKFLYNFVKNSGALSHDTSYIDWSAAGARIARYRGSHAQDGSCAAWGFRGRWEDITHWVHGESLADHEAKSCREYGRDL